MAVLALLMALAAILWTGVVCFGNSMTDAPNAPFRGGETVWLVWILAAVAIAAWAFS
ncbi:hypothetical protein [Bradyrhizobium lablabi]|uniref:hypothetical protein n=1 Tax=Bradyrhizobium lablabi TaxID=722472 RepID=UPI00289E8044|nr:hypothetical protein [Bradyrhizobium lablabi]